MKFVNNWQRPITLAAGAATAALDLPDGTYRLTLSDAGRSRIEIIDAAVAAGVGALSRGLEGTADQEWPSGSVVYSTLTAGQVAILAAAGNDTLSGDEMPTQPPARVGQLYVAPWVTFVGVGTAHPEQWRSIWGAAGPGQYVEALPGGVSQSLPRTVRSVRVFSPDAATGLHRATVVVPAWPVRPEGFEVEILATASCPITLSIDLTALLGGLSETYVSVENYGTTAAFSRADNVIECAASEHLRLRMETFFIDQAGSVGEVSFIAERLPYDSITYINL